MQAAHQGAVSDLLSKHVSSTTVLKARVVQSARLVFTLTVVGFSLFCQYMISSEHC
jgi:hypothetical protein